MRYWYLNDSRYNPYHLWVFSDQDTKHPLVYGLATVFSSSHLVLLVVVSMVLCLLLGDGLVFSVLLQLCTLFCFLELHAFNIREG